MIMKKKELGHSGARERGRLGDRYAEKFWVGLRLLSTTPAPATHLGIAQTLFALGAPWDRSSVNPPTGTAK